MKFAENILDAMSRTQSPKRAPLEEDYVGKSLWFESSNVISMHFEMNDSLKSTLNREDQSRLYQSLS